MFKIEMGSKVRDKITGFTGIVIGRTEYMNGCLQYGVKPPLDKDGKMQDTFWIDEQNLEVLTEEKPARKPRTGGPSSDCPGRSY